MGARRASAVAVAAMAGAVLLVTLLVTWAASIGPGEVLRGDGPSAHEATHRPSGTRPQVPSFSPTPTPRDGSGNSGWLWNVLQVIGVVLMVLTVLLAAGFAILFLRWLGDRWVARRRPPPPAPVVEFDVVDGPRRLAEEMTRDADQQRSILLGGSPRNAIVACWHRFEIQAAEVGLVRHEWETSSEFTLRALDLVEADSRQVTRLAALYREARFSDHPLDETARQAALAALDEIHAGLPHTIGVPR